MGSNLYFKVEGGILVYVDDLTGEEKIMIDVKRNISTEFEMKYLGMMNYFLGMEVWQSADGIFLGQGNYALEILNVGL